MAAVSAANPHYYLGQASWLELLSYGCGSLSFSTLAYILQQTVSKQLIKLTPYYIEVPPYCMQNPVLQNNKHHWSALTSAKVMKPDCPLKGRIVLQFSGGHSVSIKLNDLDLAELHRFLPALAQATQADDVGKLCDTLCIKRLKDDSDKLNIPYVRNFSTASFVPLDAGTKLHAGRMTVMQPLVSGGLSAVYLVQLDTGEKAILKESNVPDTADEAYKQKALELFDREALLLAKLQHDRIAHIYDHFVENGRHYILMELIHGRDLRRTVKEQKPPEQQVLWQWALQVVQTLQFLHSQEPPIIHRDLTPDNLVLRNNTEIVLIDFGAANEFLGTATGTLVGKQAYIAPEQFRGKTKMASDIYAFGGTMHFLATGMDPIPLTQSSPKAANATVDLAFDALIQCCTELDESKRPTAAQLIELISGALACKSPR